MAAVAAHVPVGACNRQHRRRRDLRVCQQIPPIDLLLEHCAARGVMVGKVRVDLQVSKSVSFQTRQCMLDDESISSGIFLPSI